MVYYSKTFITILLIPVGHHLSSFVAEFKTLAITWSIAEIMCVQFNGLEIMHKLSFLVLLL